MSDPTLQALGARVRTLREHRELTQAELAVTVGLSRTSVTNLEAGRQGDVPATKLVSIAKALGSTVGTLLGEIPMPDLPVVQAISTHNVQCDRCGLVQADVRDAGEADGIRRNHVKGHAR